MLVRMVEHVSSQFLAARGRCQVDGGKQHDGNGWAWRSGGV